MASGSGSPSGSKRSPSTHLEDGAESSNDCVVMENSQDSASGKRMKTDECKSPKNDKDGNDSNHSSFNLLGSDRNPILVPSDSSNEEGMSDSATINNLEEVRTTNGAASPKQEDKEKKFDPTPTNPMPVPKWNVTKAVLSREYGLSSNYSPDLFRFDCTGSHHVVERFELMYKMLKHTGCVNALHFNSTGTKLVSGSDDLLVIVWDWTINEPLLEYRSGHSTNVFQAKFVPLTNDAFIVTAARDGQVRLGDVSHSPETNNRKLAQHKGSTHRLALQNDSAHNILSCGEDAAVFQIDLRKEKPEKLLFCRNLDKKVALYSIAFNPQNHFEFVVGGKCCYSKVYDTRFIDANASSLYAYCPEHLVDEKMVNVTSVTYNYNGQEILASYNDEDIYLFDHQNKILNKYKHRYQGHRNNQTVKGVNYFGSRSEFIVSGSDCGHIFFWDKETEHIVNYLYGDEGGTVNCLEPHPTMPVLATSGLDDDIKIWVPSCETRPNLSGLRTHLIRNMKGRAEDSLNEAPDDYLDRTLWSLMQHLARARRMMNNEESDESYSTSSSDVDDDDEEFGEMTRCNQS